MLATEIIKHKRSGSHLTEEQIRFFINGYTTGDIPDYQMSSLLMAIFLNGMDENETLHLTKSMLESGTRIEFENSVPVDKHSTGGVGDKTSLILASIVAACGVPVPMMSGRGLGHTGGTLDKLESIPGFRVDLDLTMFQNQVQKNGLAFIGQTSDICPADKKIYALRDVTGTVESLPLICASIMSKKIAEGIKGLVLDVKTGSGAFMKGLDDARALAQGLISIGKGYGITTQALITDMEQPLGRFIGNSLEVAECRSIMKRENFMGRPYEDFSDTEELSIELASRMIAIGLQCPQQEAIKKAKEALDSGQAFEKFSEIVVLQKGDLSKLPLPSKRIEIKSTKAGYLNFIDGEKVGLAGICIGAGRKIISDKINPTTGLETHAKLGDPISEGDLLFTIHLDEQPTGSEEAIQILENCYQLSETRSSPRPLVIERI